jgi:hypothetical protein
MMPEPTSSGVQNCPELIPLDRTPAMVYDPPMTECTLKFTPLGDVTPNVIIKHDWLVFRRGSSPCVFGGHSIINCMANENYGMDLKTTMIAPLPAPLPKLDE